MRITRKELTELAGVEAVSIEPNMDGLLLIVRTKSNRAMTKVVNRLTVAGYRRHADFDCRDRTIAIDAELCTR